ncbi:MAG: hypothetical protein QOE05_306 [Actinomycetota bacterium]|jgi:sugar diacid utilization regulator|nr:hypothetical protein [Actinomycetota bacterium]
MIADALARALARSVALDDQAGNLLAHSSHEGVVDPVRTASILSRRAPEESWAWGLQHGIATAAGPMRVPAQTAIGMDARVCVPMRCQDLLLGYLWLLDPDESLTPEQLASASAAADAAAEVLLREQLIHDLEQGRERELVRDLISEDPQMRRHAAVTLVETDLFVSAASVSALVVLAADGSARADDPDVRLALETALERTRHRLPPRHRLNLVRLDHGLLVVPLGRRGMPEPVALGEALLQAAVEACGDEAECEFFVGIGAAQSSLESVADSYRQALQATRVAMIVRSFPKVVSWDGLGVYRLLSQLPLDELTADAIHPGLALLSSQEGETPLRATLECYLDKGCDTRTTAATLAIHRASLYYRLGRIEQIAGVDLKDGEDRLALHLGLKLSKLTGLDAKT